MKLKVKDLVKITNGKLISGNENTIIQSYSKDTREIKVKDVYIGIKGTNFDGNLLYLEAFSKGASLCILEEDSFDNYEGDKPIILVKNARDALKAIASYIRDKSNIKVIGVTGSVGKTSTRDMIYSVISESYKSLKTEGNYNNDIGLPLTLMRINKEEYAVIEMGMNNLGEIDYLTKIAKPNIGVITNIGTAHIGNLGSRENILKAKLEIRNGLNGPLIINNDNDLLHKYYLKNKKDIITVGIHNKSDIMAKDIKLLDDKALFKIVYKDQEYDAICNVPNEYYIINSLIAFAVGILCNIPIDKILKGIKNAKLTSKRLEFIKTKKYLIIDDSYNASLDSMKSSLDILKNKEGRKVAILGSMLELGSFSKKLHEEVGKYVAKCKIDVLITGGEYGKDIARGAIYSGMNKDNIYSYKDNKEIINNLKDILKDNDIILVKASNGLKFNEIVKEISLW